MDKISEKNRNKSDQTSQPLYPLSIRNFDFKSHEENIKVNLENIRKQQPYIFLNDDMFLIIENLNHERFKLYKVIKII